ncbi:MAG TPA: hypothetical protein VFP59_13305 [Candidatus Angelobacter sp.]|nr:hypothetical protein [Candidatus Angelobacter sp.]
MPWVKVTPPKIRTVLLRVAQVACGIIMLILFRWTPATGRGFVIYGILLVGLVLVMIVLAPKHEGYWPDPPQKSNSK